MKKVKNTGVSTVKSKEKITSRLLSLGRLVVIECVKAAIKFYIAEILKGLF